MKQVRTVRPRRPALPPILEIDEDGVPDMKFGEGRRGTADGGEPGGVPMGDWPAELDD